jgi:acetyl-CoA carboxylase carboxyl transferase subunit alpha
MELEFEKPLLEIEARIAALKRAATEQPDSPPSPEIADLERQRDEMERAIYANLTPWQTVQVARHPNRPRLDDYLAGVFSEYVELHGDRLFGDDAAITGGFATIDKYKVMVIGHQKGKSVDENIKTRFGMGNPEGYRKALRLMKLAEKYSLPVICFVDTPGAYPGLEAEARGQAEAIARNLTEMARMETPMIVVVTGEGGSGGALGIAVGDEILMLSNAIYSVISPEGCASILWRDGAKAPEAAEALKLTAKSLLELRIIDRIITEPAGGGHRHPSATIAAVKDALIPSIKFLRKRSPRKLLKRRYEKFAAMGRFGRR